MRPMCNVIAIDGVSMQQVLKGSSGKYIIKAHKSCYIYDGSVVQFGAVKRVNNCPKSLGNYQTI